MTTDTFTLSRYLPANRPLDPTAALLSGMGVCIAFLLPSLILSGLDPRTLDGVGVWQKPIKFEISVFLHLATLLVLSALVAAPAQQTRLYRWLMTAVAIAGSGELAYIVLQAARGRASHFNDQTAIEGIMYGVMGVGALALVIASFGLGVLIWRRPSGSGSAGLRLGAIIGLTLGSVLTLVFAGYMSSALGHSVGALPGQAGALPLTGWSSQHGDMRVPHFFGTHLMQALPLLGLAADRFVPSSARGLVIAGTLLGMGLAVATFVQALYGLPLIRL